MTYSYGNMVLANCLLIVQNLTNSARMTDGHQCFMYFIRLNFCLSNFTMIAWNRKLMDDWIFLFRRLTVLLLISGYCDWIVLFRDRRRWLRIMCITYSHMEMQLCWCNYRVQRTVSILSEYFIIDIDGVLEVWGFWKVFLSRRKPWYLIFVSHF